MRLRSRSGATLVAAAIILFAAVFWRTQMLRLHLGRATELSGWFLFVTVLGLGLLNWRKKLSMIPLGRGSTWLVIHVVGGFLAIGFFYVHGQTLWPHGTYHQVLTALFYLVCLSGIFGYVQQRVHAHRLTQLNYEIIYERIPAEIADLRHKAEQAVLECTGTTGSDALARHYLDSLAWFFQRPRFVLGSVLGANQGEHWLHQKLLGVERHLTEPELPFLNRLRHLGLTKTRVDRHYASQTLLKLWLFVHVPLAAAMIVVAIWHVLLAYAYTL